MQALRRAGIWAVAVEAPLALLAALTALPAFYRAMPIVLTAHLPGITLLDSLGLCCGLGGGIISDHGPSLEPPLLLSVLVLAAANLIVLVLVLWLGFLIAGRRTHASSHHAAA
jgi:hypothetical protein